MVANITYWLGQQMFESPACVQAGTWAVTVKRSIAIVFATRKVKQNSPLNNTYKAARFHPLFLL